MTQEEELIRRYFDAFNRHDLDGVMACFHEQPVLVNGEGRRVEGRDAVRGNYAAGFALMPGSHCDLKVATGNSGRAVAESFFHGTRQDSGKVTEAMGAEVMEIVDGKIKEIRDYHRPLPAKAA